MFFKDFRKLLQKFVRCIALLQVHQWILFSNQDLITYYFSSYLFVDTNFENFADLRFIHFSNYPVYFSTNEIKICRFFEVATNIQSKQQKFHKIFDHFKKLTNNDNFFCPRSKHRFNYFHHKNPNITNLTFKIGTPRQVITCWRVIFSQNLPRACELLSVHFSTIFTKKKCRTSS